MGSQLRHIASLVAVGVSLLIAPGSASAAGGGGGVPSSSGESDGAQRIATGHYRAGLRARDAALRYVGQAEKTQDDADARRLYGLARGEFEKAITSQRKAIKAAPDLYQAHNSLGYALRRIGRYEQAIASYDLALKLEPTYGEAVEYRAEAYLQLDRLEDVQRAWGQLQTVPMLATQLMEAMERWIEKRRKNPGDLAPSRVEAFAAWVAEQPRPAGRPTASTSSARW